MKLIKRILSTTLAFFTLLACDNEQMENIAFIGDSEVARWDLKRFFPTRIVENLGHSGAGIEYVESLAGKFRDRTVVVIIGTNDLYTLIGGDSHQYALRYVDAIKGLEAKRTYLYSIFPRNFASDKVDFNKLIPPLNDEIRSSIADDETVCYLPVFDNLYSSITESINWQYSYDGLHLNDLGYELITKKLIDCL